MVIQNGIVFTGKTFEKVDIRTENGTILEVGQPVPAADETVVDAHDLYILPGFVDIHIHAYGGADCMRGEKEVRAMSRGLIQTGVAAFVPTTMSAWPHETHEALKGIQAVMDRPEADGADVLGAHMEAPFLSPKYKGAQLGECLQLPSEAAYHEMVGDLSCVRMMTLAPELEGALPFISYLRQQNVVPCAAHTASTAADIHKAADAGLLQITHLFNAQTPLHHREPGVPGAGLADDRLAVQIIADGIHLHPDILRIVGLCKGAEGTILISDSMEAAGLPDGEYTLGGQKVIVKDGAARLENGVLAGSTLVLHEAIRNMIQKAHIAPETVIPMATSTPADAVGAKLYGRIAPGCKAVLVKMDSDWQFQGVIRG